MEWPTLGYVPNVMIYVGPELDGPEPEGVNEWLSDAPELLQAEWNKSSKNTCTALCTIPREMHQRWRRR